MAYETTFMSFGWVEDWEDPKNSMSERITNFNKKGWRLIQILEVRRTKPWLTKSQVQDKAYVIERVKYQYGSADYEKRARHYKGINWQNTNDDIDKKGFPKGCKIWYTFVLERHK